MYKAKIKKEDAYLLLELLKLMSEMDGSTTILEEEFIQSVEKAYRMKRYVYQNLNKQEIRYALEDLDDDTVFVILTNVILLALVDNSISTGEKVLIKEYFDLLSLEDALKMQKLVNKNSEEELDLREFFGSNKSDTEVLDESLVVMQEFEDCTVEDIDESLLMKMKRGPVKKVWNEVMKIYTTVQDPKTSKATKVLGIGALLYLISPIDAIPDIIPMLGLTDDVGIIAYVITQFAKQAKKNNK